MQGAVSPLVLSSPRLLGTDTLRAIMLFGLVTGLCNYLGMETWGGTLLVVYPYCLSPACTVRALGKSYLLPAGRLHVIG